MVDDPPYLSVGTAVSAKYKGAFCEAKVSKVVRIVKCKVTYKMGLGTATVSDEQIKGTLRVGHTVQAKHQDRREFVEATITKIQDCSQYTVVFDDGDITTLRRSALCLKSGRHFNESETLDQLPLTHPEHFGNPVVGGRRGRRNRQLKEESSEGEAEEENEPDLEGYTTDIGRVVSVEATDKKRNKDSWFPGLVVIPSAQPTVRINVKDEYLIRSFKDGRYYTVPKKEVSEFSREIGEKVESSVLSEAVNKALKYLDNNELPIHWERNSLFNMQSLDTDSEDNYSDSSDDEPNEEKDRFVAQLYKFMDDSGTPLNKSPMIGSKDVDLHKLFKLVHKMGGYNRVTNQSKWRSVTTRLKLPNNQITYNQVKAVYKKCLFSYESFYKTLGVTMLNISTKKNRGRSLIRDKDRGTPVNSPKPDKEEEMLEKKEEEKIAPDDKIKKKSEFKKEDDKKRKEPIENSDTNSSDATDQSESVPGTSKESRPRRLDRSKEKKPKPPTPVEKPKPVEAVKIDDEKAQLTRSKAQIPKPKEIPNTAIPKKEMKTSENPMKLSVKQGAKKSDDEKKRGRKKTTSEDKPGVEIVSESLLGQTIRVGDKLKVFYGPSHEYKVTYEAKVIEIEKDANGLVYLVHYTGWNTRYDEWIAPSRVAENLSASTKAKRLKQSSAANSPVSATKQGPSNKTVAAKRGRGTSVGSKSAPGDIARSTTPSSVTSTSSRTKSPATPATRSSSRMTRLDYGRRTRRSSAQTDISNHSDTDSEISESESELSRTRSGSKADDVELKTYKKKSPKSASGSKSDKSKDKEDPDTEKEEESDRPKRTRKMKKSPEKSGEESDDDTGSNPPKGRDFDLNQIRSELKGFAKAVKVPSLEATDKEVSSSSDDLSNPMSAKPEPVEEKKEAKTAETSPTSDDIYEFKEPEPFEFEARSKIVDEKTCKKRIPRVYEEVEKCQKKKIIRSPGKSDKDSPEMEKKRFRRTPVCKQDDSEDEDKRDEDPFDKLVESPSFNLKPPESKQKRSTLEETLNVFSNPSEDFGRDIDLSDSESRTQPIFARDDEIFSGTFSKYSPDRNTLDLEFTTKDDDLKKDDDLESIRESITRAMARTPTSDECDNMSDDELLITTSNLTYQAKKRDAEPATSSVECTRADLPCKETVDEAKVELKEEFSQSKSPLLQISPALQETDSSLLESICAQPLSITAKLEETKDLNLKTGTKIADSLLQKFSSLKNKGEVSPKADSDSERDVKKDADLDLDDDTKLCVIKAELKLKPSEAEAKKSTNPMPPKSEPSDTKKRRKVVSRAYIEESDTNSSDSEQLVIARSDEDSQTNSLDKPDLKESDSNMSAGNMATTDDSQSQGERRNFKFDVEKAPAGPELAPKDLVDETEVVKEDEPDSQLHSLLLCEETIPRSPPPVSEGEQRPKTKSVLEIPFASAPGSSNNKNTLLNNEHKPAPKPQPPPIVLPLSNRDNREVSTVITPPSTPGSSTSGDHGELSPNTIENESCKSNDAEPEYPRKRRNSSLNKVPLYSEEDTQMTNEPGSGKKSREESVPATCRKRRKSARGSDEVPPKRGRKPLNRSRHNSDSDDTSEHSLPGTATNLGLSTYDRTAKSPRPSKYNFFVEFDPSLNSGQRIAVLQQKLSELRKTYAEVKAELAAVERRRKKIRRREREALKASKQEMVCG